MKRRNARLSSASITSRLTVAAVAVAVAGCGGNLFESKKIDYKSSANAKAPTLEVPPDLVAPTRDDRFSVPDVAGKGGATFSAYTAERSPQARAQQQSDVLPTVDKTRIERAGTQRWLVVAGSPDKVWDTVKDFWQEMGFVVAVEVPEAGVLETDWAENRAKIPQDMLRNLLGKVLDSLYSTPERDKFRTRLEPGSEPGTTDVFISHRGMYEVYVTEGKDQTRWQPRPADPELEAEMLRRLMVRFGTDEKKAAAAVAASQEKLVEKAKLARGNDGIGSVQVDESFDRAWRRLGLALDRVGFTVEDRDRSKGLYFVRYVDPDVDNQKKEDGFLSKLAFWKGKPTDADPQTQYRVYLRDDGAVSTVQVLSREGGVDRSDTARKILSLLYEQLK
ncbi:outer membrane protein assembly factor BamC [Rhodocyclus tenuis]|uniref:Outer membrane protein assembly factor BamC n=2 Tax=Rhodocyclus TaxID=1064 RepID=A0A6L5JS11_RHOTE|nr:outer membrane protein assembly factor BamC [Rhodocyclus gracilis]MQY50227.1 outer membrane protein assembly factor BamC [Rhodocyclus gracilis]MRD71876.1 outer membrane protein assembly factor BamC [Rhodocyclus gracilis]NJA87730.1 outer membrane protein assembly factor BamC [Rhodocyclus gracilis]